MFALLWFGHIAYYKNNYSWKRVSKGAFSVCTNPTVSRPSFIAVLQQLTSSLVKGRNGYWQVIFWLDMLIRKRGKHGWDSQRTTSIVRPDILLWVQPQQCWSHFYHQELFSYQIGPHYPLADLGESIIRQYSVVFLLLCFEGLEHRWRNITGRKIIL